MKKPAPKKRKAGRPSLYTEALAANPGETEPMAILKNARHEKFAQYIAKGTGIRHQPCLDGQVPCLSVLKMI